MLSAEEFNTVANFFLDGAKILFGSLVVGAFIPSASGKIPWLTLIGGIAVTLIFLTIAAKLVTIAKTKL